MRGDEGVPPARGNRRFVVLLLAIVAVALALRLGAITRGSLDNDEIAEVEWSRKTFPGMLRRVAADRVHPPLDYACQWVVSRLTRTETWHRVPGVVFGAGTVLAMGLLTASWFGEMAGLAAAALIAASPVHIRYSQEARPYSIGLFFLVLAVLLLERHRRRGSRRLAAGWWTAVFLAGASLYFAGAVAVLVSLVFIAVSRGAGLRPLWRRLPLFIAAWALLYAPWLPVVFAAAGSTSGTPAGRMGIAWALYRAQVLGTGDWKVEPVSAGSWCFWALVAAGIAIFCRRREMAPAAAWLAAGGAFELIVLRLVPHFSAVRHLLPAWSGAFVLAGAGVAGLARRPLGAAVAFAALALVFVFDASTLRAFYRAPRPDWRAVVRRVASQREATGAVALANAWTARDFGFYWREDGHPPGRLFVLPDSRESRRLAPGTWLVASECADRAKLRRIPLVARFPGTNHCDVYRVGPAPVTLSLPLCPAP